MSKEPTSPTGCDIHGMTPEDRHRLIAKSDAEIEAEALADPDAQPIPPERLARMARPLAKVVRHKLRLSQEDFASSYGIPLDVVRAWERGESTPSLIEQAYLRLIDREPERSKLLPA